MEIADAVTMNGAAEKWDVDWPTFELALAALTHTEAVAVLEVVERFWADQRIGVDHIAPLVASIRSRVPLWTDEGDNAGKPLAKRA